MLPPVSLSVPLYMGLAALGLLNTIYGLALVYLTILAPFTTWLLKPASTPIPQEIESAAMIDGARLDQTMRIVILPLAATDGRRRRRCSPSCSPGTSSSTRCCSPRTSAPRP